MLSSNLACPALDDPGQPLDRVVLLHDFSEALGGASHLVQVLIAQLRSARIPVTFIAGDRGAGFRRDDVDFVALGGLPLLDIPRLAAATMGLYNRRFAAVLRDWIHRHDTPGTVYHLHGWSKILTPAVFAALRPVRERLLLHAHDYFNACPNGAFFDYQTGEPCRREPLSMACLTCRCDRSGHGEKLWRSAREALRRQAHGGIGNAARMLLIHPGQAGNFALGRWPADRLHALRNPVAPPCDRRVAAEANYGIVFVGRLSVEKGADLAARAARMAGLPITFVGDGAELSRVRMLCPRARFLGRQDRAGVARALASARIAVMPSRWPEPFGLVALEAIGSGVPVVVNHRALVADEIAGAGFGVALDTGDVKAFAAALVQLHADNAGVERMSRAGHAGYRDLCSSEEEWGQAVVGHYRAVLAQAAAAGRTS